MNRCTLRGFSLAEVVIASIFIGILATLTIPSTFSSLKYREHVTAYKNAFGKVKEVVASAAITDSTFDSAHRLYKLLNDSLPVIGYSDAGIVNGVIPPGSDTIRISASTMAERAVWGNGTEAVTVGSPTGSTVSLPNGYSPWIVTENGIAFSVYTWNVGSCGTISNIFHASQSHINGSLAYKAAYIGCAVLLVDVNGLDKGPNKSPSLDALTQDEAYNQIKENDRFLIFIGSDGATAGPEGDRKSVV